MLEDKAVLQQATHQEGLMGEDKPELAVDIMLGQVEAALLISGLVELLWEIVL
jgi:uncharacterized membrane protein